MNDTTLSTGRQDMAPRLVGDLAIWLVILIEMFTFAIFFLTYAFMRAQDVELFNASQATLDLEIGVVNTVFLISGSWCVARAVHAVRADDVKSGARWLEFSLLCAAGFLALKGWEYADKMSAGLDMSTNNFYMFYYMLTGFHFLHVLLATGLLAILLFNTRRGAYGSHDCHALETGAAFWHMVDLLWIVLFPLVYVMR